MSVSKKKTPPVMYNFQIICIHDYAILCKLYLYSCFYKLTCVGFFFYIFTRPKKQALTISLYLPIV